MDEFFLFALPETCHQENLSANTGIAEWDGFIQRSNAKPGGPFALQRLRTLHRAVTISICFNDGAHSHTGAYVLLYHAEVMAQILQRNFGPSRTGCRATLNFDSSHLSRL